MQNEKELIRLVVAKGGRGGGGYFIFSWGVLVVPLVRLTSLWASVALLPLGMIPGLLNSRREYRIFFFFAPHQKLNILRFKVPKTTDQGEEWGHHRAGQSNPLPVASK